MNSLILREDIVNIKNHYIITKHRSGSTLLACMLGINSGVQAIHEENIYEKFKSVYDDKFFDNKQILESFLDNLYQYPTQKTIIYYLQSKDVLLKKLSFYLHYKLCFRDFVNLIYLFFFSNHEKKNVKTIINKDVLYQVRANRIYIDSPNSKFIFLVRDSITNINSTINTGLTTTNVVYHSAVYNMMMNDLLMQVRKMPTDSYMIVKYEDFIANNEEMLLKICSFLSIKFEAQMLDNVQAMQVIDEYSKLRFYENHGYYPDVDIEEEKIHRSTRKKLNKDKIQSHALNQTQLNKIYRITNKVRVRLGYESIKVDNRAPLSLADLFYYMNGIFIMYILYYYYSSGFITKKILRRINVFKFFN